jgi:predicted MPP superfamily phosphohydrolase
MRRLRTLVLANGYTRVAVLSAIWLSLFAYAGRPLLIGAAAAGVSRVLAWSALVGLALLPVLARRTKKKLAQWTGYATLAVFSTLLMLVLLSDVARAVYLAVRWAIAGPAWPLVDPRMIAFTILIATGALSLVGLLQARCPRVQRVTIPLENLPPELEGYRIVQWSDVHVGPTIRRRFVQNLVERTNTLDADAVAITGDFVDGPCDELREHIAPLDELRTRDGVFYVTGNHEYYWRASEWVPEIESHGVTFLKNEHRLVRPGLVIAGVTDPMGRYTHKQDPKRALAGAPADAVKVLLSHRPQLIAEVDLQLSGHTHGGQFFPFSLFIKYFQPIVAGLHRVGRTWLYVNRGTGYWGPPSRLGVGGEITVIELRRP